MVGGRLWHFFHDFIVHDLYPRMDTDNKRFTKKIMINFLCYFFIYQIAGSGKEYNEDNNCCKIGNPGHHYHREDSEHYNQDKKT